MFRTTVIVCTIVTQVLAAPNPNGCIEACSTYHSQQTHEALIQQQTAALNELQQVAASRLKSSEFSRPGNWTEQNEYRTDDGRGRVYEEHGQVVSGPRRVQYYKKNYSSSHGVSSDAGALGSLGDIQSSLDSQRLTGSTSGLGSAAHHSTYDEHRHREVHQSTNRVADRSGRLEDFGEGVDDTQQVLQQVPSLSSGGNWHRADSWRTDGGRGVVHEEEGQLVNGPTKVKYYRQNYSSSYSSGDVAAVVPSIAQPNLEAELQRLHSQMNSYGRDIHQSTVGQSSLGSLSQTAEHGGYVDENLATTKIRPQSVSTYENTREQQQSTIRHGVVAAPVSNYHRTRGERYRETESSGRDYSATNSHVDDRREGQTSQRFYVVPSRPLATVEKSEAHQVYQETIAPQSQIVLTSANGHSIDRTDDQLLHVPIHTNSNYRSFHSNGEAQGNRLTTTHSQIQTAEEIRQAQVRQSQIFNQNLRHQNLYTNGNVETVDLIAQQPAAVNSYEKWSEGYRSHSTVPQQVASGQIVVGQHANYVKTTGQTAGQLGSYSAANSRNSHSSHHESGSHFYEGFRTQPDQLVTGALSLGKIGQTGADCDEGVTASEQYQYGSIRQRKYKREAESGFHGHENDDLSQQSHRVEDLTQQTAEFDDFYQQHSGNLEYGQQHQQEHSGKLEFGHETQQTEDLTQQPSGFGDYSQQASGNLEFGHQQQQQHSGKLEFGHETQQTEDLTQQSSGFGDYSQQASGNLEFGHQQQQQHSGKLEFGHETQQTEDLTQQPSGFGDYTQQTAGNLEFGQQYQQEHSGKLEFGHETQQTEDLTQQPSDFGDYSQQASGNLEFGHQQQQQHSGKLEFGHETQQTEDLTQQSSGFGDYSQQASGNLEFGHQQQQQHSGKLEFGHETQQTEDLIQQTSGFGDYSQQASGNLEFGHQQQQQHSGKLEFGHETQQTEDLTQQPSGFGDYTQQASGNLEFEQQHQQEHSGKLEFGHETQQTEDLTQQPSGFGDYTQQASGNLEFEQQHQQEHSGKLEFGHETQQTEDLTQQPSGFGDYTQQASGNLEFGQQHQQEHSGKLEFGQETQQTEDLTQQPSGFGDYTQQASGNLEFGQQHQQEHSGKLEFGQETQQTEDLIQQTSGFGDYSQQPSGNLEFGHQQQQQHSGKLEFGKETQQTEDLTQQPSGFGDYSQQVSGKLEFGHQRQHGKHEFNQETQQTEGLSHHTGGFGDFMEQSSGNLELGQDQQQTGTFEFGEQTTTAKPQQTYQPGVKGGRRRKPAPKPTLRSGRRHSFDNDAGDTNLPSIDNSPLDAHPQPDLDHFLINSKQQDVPTVLGIDESETQQSQDQETSHKNNINARWHLNNRPGGLTNGENLENHQIVNHQVVHEEHIAQTVQNYPTNSGRPRQQTEGPHSRQSSSVEGENSEPVFKLEPRIIEAYGGAGTYDADHNDDLFTGAKHNPSATLPPNSEGLDPWYIREKPAVSVNRPMIYTYPTEETTTAMPEEPTTTPATSFWSRIGNKLSNTYEKAKEKATSIFGK